MDVSLLACDLEWGWLWVSFPFEIALRNVAVPFPTLRLQIIRLIFVALSMSFVEHVFFYLFSDYCKQSDSEVSQNKINIITA